MAKLVVTNRGQVPTVHELGDGWITIGRADDNVFQILEESISSRHCEVRVRGNELMVRDLISTNGTFINGRRVADGVVRANEILRLGDVEMRFDTSDVSGEAAAIFRSKMLVSKTSRPAQPALAEKPVVQPAKDEPGRRFHVLFVDDSNAFLDSFGGLCEEFSGFTWKIHKADSADAALTVLRETPIDLILLDVGMPTMDGLQLLGIIIRRYPGMKTAVITANVTEERRADALAKGAEVFLEKPMAPEQMQATFNVLLDLLLWNREGFTGALRHVSLQEVVQVECMGHRSSIMEIRNPEMNGRIYLKDGDVLHAVTGEMSGLPAFQRLMSLSGGEFQLKPFHPPKQRTINMPWEYLLMQSAPGADDETVILTREDIGSLAAPAPGPAANPIVAGHVPAPVPTQIAGSPPGRTGP
jgi:CheY-like chemotaxis protein